MINEQQTMLTEIEETNAVLKDVMKEFNTALASSTVESAEAVLSVLQTVLAGGEESEMQTEASISKQKALLDEASKNYETFTAATDAKISSTTTSLETLHAAKPTLETDLSQKQDEVAALEKTRETKFTVCNGGTRQEKYETQRAGREKEIDDLQQVLQILNAQ